MSTLSSLISGGGGGALPQIALTQSQTWVPPQDGNVCIHVIGAGGNGSVNTAQGYPDYSGGAGGYCKKNSLAVTTGGSYTVVVGVGGPRHSSGTVTAGGNSTVAGTGLSATLTANGGAGGGNGAGGGGSSANGDVNNTGGAGYAGSRGGGGAVGIYGTGEAGVQNTRGGDSDAQGGESGFGHIGGGGKGGVAAYMGASQNSNLPMSQAPDASGPFAGGGSTLGVNGNTVFFGGNGGTGGGGGGCTAGTAFAGAGGDGLVLIQYLPS